MRYPLAAVASACLLAASTASHGADDPGEALLARARRLHAEAILVDGHNDLPWRLRDELKDFDLSKTDLSKRLPDGHTDIPRLRDGGVKAQFWSVWIPGTHPHAGRTVIEQIDLVHRMIARYPDDFTLALRPTTSSGSPPRARSPA
jgi:membrane dipeptidase